MSIWKIVSGVLSIVLFVVVLFQSLAAGVVNTLSQNGDISGSAGLIVAILLLVGGIVSIATRDAVGNGGNFAIIVLYGLAAGVGYLMAGIYADLVIWATWCLLCAVIAAIAIAADNVCDAWVYVFIVAAGLGIAGLGLRANFSGEDADGPKRATNKVVTPVNNSNNKNNKTDKGSDKSDKNNASTPNEDPQQAEPEMKEETSPNSNGKSSGTLGDYYVEIKGAELAKDYEGETVIVITYAWTNNSEDTKSAMVSTNEKAFQDGIELDAAFVVKGVDFGNNSKDVRPGNTIDVRKAYVLTSDSSTVEFEVTEFLSFSDDMVTMNFNPQSLR